MSWRKEHNSAVQAYSSAQSAISFVIWYQITETIKEDAQNGSEQKNKKKRARALFLCKLTTNTNFKTLGCWGNVNKYKSHKPRFYSQENIKNVSNVKTETFYYSIIFWQQHISKLGQGEETAEKVVVIVTRLGIKSFSEVKMGTGSPICKKLHLQIVGQFQSNVPQ